MSAIRVFVIDDSSTVRRILCRLIEQNPNCELVGFASDVEGAKDCIATQKPDVITLDLTMPGGDGMDHLAALGSDLRPAIVVVSASTRIGSPETLRALAHGADACFDKGRIVSDADLFIRTLMVAARRHDDWPPSQLRA